MLAANLQAEENIYLNATQAQKVRPASIAIIENVSANILSGAFPANPAFGTDATSLPSAPVKLFFGQLYDIYGNTSVITSRNAWNLMTGAIVAWRAVRSL